MIIFNLIHNSIFLLFLGLAIFVLVKNKKALLNIMVFILLLFFSLYSLALSFIQNPLSNEETAEFFMHLANLASIGYGIFTFLSVCVFTKIIKPNIILYSILAIYFIAVLAFQLATDFASVVLNNYSNLWMIDYNNREIFLLVSFMHNTLVLSSFVLLIIFIRKKIDYIQRKQSVIILTSGVISFALATLTLFLPKMLPQFQIPILVDLCMVVFAVGFVYSIVKYDLFEIMPKMVVNQIIDILPVGLIIADINRQIIRINKSLLEITNRSRNDFENVQLNEAVQSLTGEKFDLADISDSAKRVNFVIDERKSKPVLLYSKKLIDRHNRLVGALLLIQDIEQLIITQERLEGVNKSLEKRIQERTMELVVAKEKAEESNRLKTVFLNNISHEIRTPLNAISGFSALLGKQDLSDEKRESFVTIIQDSSEQLVSIVTSILTISSLETKQEKCYFEKVCVNQIFVNLHSTFNQQAIKNNTSLIRKQQLSDEQSEIITDEAKLIQILSNLLANALKYTHEGSVEFGYSLKTNILEFYVKDSGIGIDSRFHEKIFERFRQADRSADKIYEGLGVGLSISKGYTELLGGEIWVQSEPGKGSTFYFTIPYKPVNNLHEKLQDSMFRSKTNKRKKVLITEDEEYNFLLIEELLINQNLELIHAKNGEEAVKICSDYPNIDLVLMDIKMPIMDGHTAAKIIRKQNPEIPIIAQSAYALKQEIEKYGGVFDSYLIKPIDSHLLEQLLVRFIGRE